MPIEYGSRNLEFHHFDRLTPRILIDHVENYFADRFTRPDAAEFYRRECPFHLDPANLDPFSTRDTISLFVRERAEEVVGMIRDSETWDCFPEEIQLVILGTVGSLFATENAGKHSYPLFSEGEWRSSSTSP